MATASPSGKGAPGQVLVQLEPQLMRQIKAMIRQRTRFLSEGEFATIGLFIELLPCARAQLARQPASYSMRQKKLSVPSEINAA